MRVRAITLAFFVVLSLIGALTAPAPSALAAGDDDRAREDQMALLVGRSRVDAGMLPLARSAALNRAAESHARNMVDRRHVEQRRLDDRRRPRARPTRAMPHRRAARGWWSK